MFNIVLKIQWLSDTNISFLQIVDQSASRQANEKWNRRKSEGLFYFFQYPFRLLSYYRVRRFVIVQQLSHGFFQSKMVNVFCLLVLFCFTFCCSWYFSLSLFLLYRIRQEQTIFLECCVQSSIVYCENKITVNLLWCWM